MESSGILVVLLTALVFVPLVQSINLPNNNGLSFLLVDKFGQTYQEYRANNGTMFKSLDNSILVGPQDVEAYNNKLYVTGYHNAITTYDQTTLQYIGIYKSFGASTQAMKFVDSNSRIAIILYHEYSDTYNLTMLSFASSNQITTMVCSAKCFDVLQNPLNSSKFLLATSNAVEQYRYTTSANASLTYDSKYINLTGLGFTTQSKVMLQWVSGKLYVGLSSPSRILRFTPSTSSATFDDVFLLEPRSNWNLMGFAFYPGSTTQVVVAGWADSYYGYLYSCNSTSSTCNTITTTNLTQLSYVGVPTCASFDTNGNLLVCDFSWISRWNASTGAFYGQISHQQTLSYPLGVTYNPLGDLSKAYVATSNRVIVVDRNSAQATSTFIPRVLDGGSDGISISYRMVWVNNTLWVSANEFVIGFDSNGQQVATIGGLPCGLIADIKLSPLNGKIYAACYFTTDLYEMNLTSYSFSKVNLTLAGGYIAFSPNGRIMYTCKDSGCTAVSAFNTTTWTLIRSSSSVVSGSLDLEVGSDGVVYVYSAENIVALNGTSLASLGILANLTYNYRGWIAPSDMVLAPTPLPSATPTPTPSITPSITPSVTPSVTPSPSGTPSVTPTPSPTRTPSISPSNSITPSPSPSVTPSTTPSPSSTPSISPSVTPSTSPSETPSATPSRTPSATSSVTPTSSPSNSVSPSIGSSPSNAPQSTPTTTPSLNGDPDPQESSPAEKGHSSSSVAIGAGVGVAGAFLVCAMVAGLLVRRRRKNKKQASVSEDDDVPMEAMPGHLSAATISPTGPTVALVSHEEALKSRVAVGIPWMDTNSNPASELASSMFHQFWEIDFAELEIGDEIGRGAFGSVFKGEWRNSYCVVKQLQMKAVSKEAITAFLKEANTVKVLRNHRNVCTIFGVCTNPEKPICIVMEYCNGGNLQSALIQKKIMPTLPNLIRIFKDITSGMSHVHREGIVHCDLACRNMLVSFEGNGDFAIKISDFGFARVIPKEGISKAGDDDIFPIRWSAPELLRDKLLSRAVDVWSFGVVMWEIIEGATPYGLLNNAEVIEYVCERQLVLEEPARIAQGLLPKSLYSIMKDCWALEPYKRPSFDDLTKTFKELDKDTGLKESFLVHDGAIETPYWSKDSQNQSKGLSISSNEYGNIMEDKYSRYCKIVRDPEVDAYYGNRFNQQQ